MAKSVLGKPLGTILHGRSVPLAGDVERPVPVSPGVGRLLRGPAAEDPRSTPAIPSAKSGGFLLILRAFLLGGDILLVVYAILFVQKYAGTLQWQQVVILCVTFLVAAGLGCMALLVGRDH